MPKFSMRLSYDTTAYADLVIEAETSDEAVEIALSEKQRNSLNWLVSEGNYAFRDEVSIIEIEELF